MTVTANRRCCLRIWVVAEVIIEILVGVLVEVVIEVFIV